MPDHQANSQNNKISNVLWRAGEETIPHWGFLRNAGLLSSLWSSERRKGVVLIRVWFAKISSHGFRGFRGSSKYTGSSERGRCRRGLSEIPHLTSKLQSFVRKAKKSEEKRKKKWENPSDPIYTDPIKSLPKYSECLVFKRGCFQISVSRFLWFRLVLMVSCLSKSSGGSQA